MRASNLPASLPRIGIESRIFPVPRLLVATNAYELPHMPAGEPLVYRAADSVYCDNHFITHGGELVTMQHQGGGMIGMRSHGGEWETLPRAKANELVAWSLIGLRLDERLAGYVRAMEGL